MKPQDYNADLVGYLELIRPDRDPTQLTNGSHHVLRQLCDKYGQSRVIADLRAMVFEVPPKNDPCDDWSLNRLPKSDGFIPAVRAYLDLATSQDLDPRHDLHGDYNDLIQHYGFDRVLRYVERYMLT